MKKTRIDLFEMTDEGDRDRGKIKAVIEGNAKIILRELVMEIKRTNNLTMRQICNSINISYTLYRMHFKRNIFYLESIKKLIKVWSKITNKSTKEMQSKTKQIQSKISRLCCGSGNNFIVISIPKKINCNLCLMAGSIVADGNLYKNDKKWSLIIADQNKDNIELFSKWCLDNFNFKTSIKRKKNERCWYIEFSNKIIFRYFNKIMGVPSGNKSSIVFMPYQIKKLSLPFRISFIKGVLMFDGGSKFYKCNFDFSTRSRRLFKDALNTLKEANIEADFISSRPNPANNLFQFSIWNKEKLKKFIRIFLEKNTTKWKQIEYQINPKAHTIEEIKVLYPEARKNTLTYDKVFKLISRYDMITKKQLTVLLDRNERNVGALLNNLNRWNIIDYENFPSGKLWRINNREVEHA